MAHTYRYPRAALTVDCVVFGLDHGDLKIMLIQRDLEPFRGEWALPGGFVHVDETLEQAALRELEEETGLARVYLEQLRAFSDVDRDPRDAAWFSIGDIPSLAFDHQEIVDYAIEELRIKTRREPIGIELLPPKFTLTPLRVSIGSIAVATISCDARASISNREQSVASFDPRADRASSMCSSCPTKSPGVRIEKLQLYDAHTS